MFSKMNARTHNHKNIILITWLLCIYMIGWINQSAFLLNWDVAWALEVGKRLLAGGTYVTNFFDVNPPLTMYLYAPPHLLTKVFPISIMLAFRIYIFILASASLCASYFFIRKILNPMLDMGISQQSIFFITAIAIIFLVLPQYHFGQREHLVLFFTIPYFLSVAYRLHGFTIKPFYAILLGLYAGIGFCIKPYFLLTFALIELYYLWYSRKITTIFRIESIVIYAFILLYILFIFMIHPNYINVIFPLAMKYFYIGYNDPWKMVIFHPVILYFLFTGIFLCLTYQKNSYKILSIILFLSAFGFIFSYFIQRTAWDYHYLPLLSMLILLMVLLLELYVRDIQENYKKIFAFFMSVLIFFYPITFIRHNYQGGISYKKLIYPLVDFMENTTANKTVYFLTINIDQPLPAVDYSKSILVARFAHPPILLGFLKKSLSYQSKQYPEGLIKDKNFLINLIIDDLNTKKPQFIFVDIRKHKDFMNFNFDFIEYFSQNNDFQKLWKNYQYLGNIEQKKSPNDFFYQLAVYERRDG